VRRTLEAIFRHPLQLLTLIIFLPILGVAVTYILVPRTYQASTTIWALQRYFVIGATGSESDLTSTPAQTQATALTELLQTRSFALSIAQGIQLAPTLGLTDSSNSETLQDAEFANISKYVVATPLEYNLYSISYTGHDPQVAQQVVKAVIADFGTQSLGLSVAEGKNLLENYQTQLASAQKDANNDAATESQYIAAHPKAKLAEDPEYALLESKRLQAQINIQNIQTVINNIEQSVSVQGSNVNTLFQIIDTPQIPSRPLSRTKDYVVGGGIGLVLAILACSIFLVVLVRKDRGVYSTLDLKDVVLYPIVLQLPKLKLTTVSMLTTSSLHPYTLSESDKNGAK
jgi:uncharacterized protein involved in exopolysaccharide biosynthesis